MSFRLVVLVASVLLAAPLQAARIQPEVDLEYLGAFRVPAEPANGTWSYGGSGLTYDPEGDPNGPKDGFPGSLFGIGDLRRGQVSEIDIPIPRRSPTGTLGELPEARTLQPFAQVTHGLQTNTLTGTSLGDVEVVRRPGQEPLLFWLLYTYYMPVPEKPTLGWKSVELTASSSAGPWRIGSFPSAATSRYLFQISPTWASTYTPGRLLAAGRSRVVLGGSWGPALYAVRSEIPSGLAAGGTVDAIELLKYDQAHPIQSYSNADNWADGAWLEVGNKSAVVFAGTKAERVFVRGGPKPALQRPESGLLYYGPPGPHGCGNKGYHGEPYWGAMLFYDTAELAEVAEGKLDAGEPQPYAMLQVENVLLRRGCRKSILEGTAFDRQRRLLYVVEGRADGEVERRPIVHVWRLEDRGGLPDREPPTPPSEVRVRAAAGGAEVSWAASQDAGGTVAYVVYRGDEPIAITTEPRYSDPESGPLATYAVEARDALNNRSKRSAAASLSEDR